MSTIFLDSSASTAVNAEAQTNSALSGPEGPCERFSGLLAQALQTRQELAAATSGLQMQPLGPNLELVTDPASPPDASSLAAFAQAQGLDPTVVAWLMAEPLNGQPLPAQDSGLLAASQPPPAATSLTLADSAMAQTAPALSFASLLTPGHTATATATATGTGTGTAQAIPMPAAGLAGLISPGTATPSGPRWSATPVAPAQLTPAALQSPATPPRPAHLTAVTQLPPAALLAPSALLTPASPASVPGTNTHPASATPAPLASAPPTAAVLSLSVTGAAAIAPEPWVPGSPSSGTAAGAQWTRDGVAPAVQFLPRALVAAPALAAGSTTPPSIAVDELILDIEPGLESLWDSPSQDRPSGQPGEGSGRPLLASALPSAAAATPLSDAQDRADGYEALAQRLGEAMAQRMMARIEKGHWQIRMMLKPATLGEIEVELKMRSGELDASFRAVNPATRELLAEGMPRLREVMAQAGMDIAKTTVGDGQTSRNGENPTPRQNRRATSEAPAAESAEALATAMPRLKDSRGLDVMV